jgi:hypothetical protein
MDTWSWGGGRNDFAETVVPVKLTGERMQQVLNVMRAEMETYAQRATARFLPTTSSLIPKLNRLDAHVPSDSSSPSKADLQLRETKHVLEPTRLVQRMLEQERARHLPTMIGRLQALEQQNEDLRVRVEQKRRQMGQHLAHLDTQRALLNEVCAFLLFNSLGSDPGQFVGVVVGLCAKQRAGGARRADAPARVQQMVKPPPCHHNRHVMFRVRIVNPGLICAHYMTQR